MRERTSYSTSSQYIPVSDDEQPPPDSGRYADGSIDEGLPGLAHLFGDHPLAIVHHPPRLARCYRFPPAIEQLYGDE